MSAPSYILTTSTPDTTGIVAAITGFLAERKLSITETQHFLDPPTSRSYLRTAFQDGGRGLPALDAIAREFEPVAARFGMEWHFHDVHRRCKVVIGVYSNHEDQRRLVEWYGVPYHWFPIGAEGKVAQEAKILDLFDSSGAGLMVLARYMQVLTEEACRRLAGRAINIHHSFLPGFKGARPYYQAYDRGVKLIGATAHYVTGDLDEGPIIEQEVERVDHNDSPEELTSIGHDIESLALNRAVRWHAEHRVFVHGNRTVVLR